MNDKIFFSVGAFQGAIKQGDVASNLNNTLKQLEIAESKGVDVLCMPESFLHGYFELRSDAKKYSLDLESTEYAKLLENFKTFNKTTLLLGINERKGDEIYNTVVVIEKGKHLGQYRKAYTYPPYDYFTLGKEFPIFEKNGVKYGIIICFDSIYREPAQILALKGAQVIFCPMFNRAENTPQILKFLNRKGHFISRAYDNESWFVSSDIVCEDDGDYVCAGYATIVDKEGEVVCRSQPFAEMIMQYDIPLSALRDDDKQSKRFTRLRGNPGLNKIVETVINGNSK